MIKLSQLTTIVAGLGLAVGSASTLAYEKGDTILRVGAAYVNQHSGSDSLTVNGGKVNGTKVVVDDDAEIGLTLAYMLTDHIGLELLASTPFSHRATVSGVSNINPALPDTFDLADVKHLPPTINVQYYPLSSSSGFQPYIGAGLNYTMFFDEKLNKEAESVLGGGDISLSDSYGLSLQIGADIAITETFALNIAVWHLDLETEADVKFDSGLRVKTDIQIDPTVIMLGGAFKF